MASRATQYRPVQPAGIDSRTAIRHPVSFTRTTLRRLAEEPESAELTDLSIYGCRILTGEMLAAGERLWLRFTGGIPIAATVVWCSDGLMGCRFDKPIASRVARSLTLVSG